jgi:anthraniloyl-CoA monooxygenase
VQALVDRCEEVGADIRWGEPLTTDRLADLMSDPDVDLIAAADGIHSGIRAAHAEAFGAVDTRGSRFAWLGTTRRFDCLTFIFRRTAAGVFHAHAYPFDRDASAFIVQCGDDTWRRAGLETLSPEARLARCREIFAADLEDEALFPDHATWRRSATVRNRTLHLGKLALVGDAAHAVHFSIGSGIRLAFQGALTLDAALMRQTRVADALDEYSAEMSAFLEPIQRISAASASYFDRVDQHVDADIAAFAIGLLTRTGASGYERLSRRHPDLVARGGAAACS